MILLPYPLDLFPYILGKIWIRFSSWNPINAPVIVRFDPPDDSLIDGEYAGTIASIIDDIVIIGPVGQSSVRGSALIINLDIPISWGGHDIKKLIAIGRYTGHEFPRLKVAPCAVNIYSLSNTNQLPLIDYTAQLGIGIVRLKWSK